MKDEHEIDFEELVDAHYQALYRFGYSLSGNEHDASDLVQETFSTFALKGSSIRDRSKAKTWLFTTLHRHFLRQFRKSKRVQVQSPEILANPAPPIDCDSALDALVSINETYRTPLTLYYLRHFNYREIGEILEIPIGTVMSRLARGKTELKKILLHSPKIDQ